MKSVILMLICLAIAPLAVQAGELYRWADSSGKVHYSDVPPPMTEGVETKKFSSATGPEEALPYETQRAKQNFPVTLYVASSCGETCIQARSLLNKRGVPFSEKSLKTKEDVEAFKQLSGVEGVPVLAIGKTYLRGFLAEQWQNELDLAGYPKTPPYRAPDKPATPDASNQAAPAAPAAQ